MIKLAKDISFDEFLKTIKATKTYKSNAYKEYRVVKADNEFLVLRDQRTKEDFQVPTIKVYMAMQENEIKGCTVARMRAYVGTKPAPSCAALIFAKFGRGQMHESFRLLSKMVFKLLKEQ